MNRHKDGFEKIERSKQCLYGPRKLLLCGFSAPAQAKFKELLALLDLNELPLIWAAEAEAEKLLGELFAKADGSGEGKGSELPRAIVAAGIAQQKLHLLMNGCRQAGMRKSLWAVLTPTSEKWPLSQLLTALAAEAKAMAEKRTKQRG